MSKYKKSFTLVELSVVLLVLSILTGTLLVGRKIVDRANVQRIIFEIDKYKTEFYQFHDTYGVLPGNMDEDNCMKNSEFYTIQNEQDKKSGKNVVVGEYCTKDRTNATSKSRTIDGYASLQIMATQYNWSSFFNAMRYMKTAGMIQNVKTDITDGEYSGQTYTGTTGSKDNVSADFISYDTVKNTQAITSFDSEGAITIAGISLNNEDNSKNAYFIRGSNGARDNKHEFYNQTYADNVNNKNILVFYRNVPAIADATYGISDVSTGLLTSSIMNQLDTKIDDGKPATGKVLALKNGYAHKVDENTKKKICYSSTEENVDQGYYLNDSDIKNGCNFIYVL